MTIRPQKHLLLPLLAVSMSLALAAPVMAQDRHDLSSSGPALSFQVQFGFTPHWTSIQGTQVECVREAERPNYDLFRFGGMYYAYNNERWYTSRRESGDFTVIDDSSVPSEFSRIPREHWRNYPSSWGDRNDRGSSGPAVSFQVHFGGTPHWAGIQGTRVEYVPQAERPDYDVFRYGGMYYAYNNERWYTSRRESGDFTVIDDSSVPSEFSRIPREQWRNYPSSWRDRDDRGSQGPAMSLQVHFGATPRWVSIRGSNVRVIRDRDRPSYDMFRYGGAYYVYNDNRWYMSRRPRGQFNVIDVRSVPNEVSWVPREHWRNYPPAWLDEQGNQRSNRHNQRGSRGRGHGQMNGRDDN